MADTIAARPLELDRLRSMTVTAGTKGLPPSAVGKQLDTLGQEGWNILAGDVPLPACVLRRDALDHNRATMKEFVERTGVRLAPHGKTTMTPMLFAEQLADGAWGITAATPAHLFAYRSVGIQRIFYANQLIDPIAIRFVIDELARDPSFEFMCLVDSEESVEALRAELRRAPGSRPIDVLIEMGLPGRRTGVRDPADAVALGRRIQLDPPVLRLRGVEAFEGIADVGTQEGAAEVGSLLGRVAVVVTELFGGNPAHSPRPIVSVGGSVYFGMAAGLAEALQFPVEVVLRSGCYLVNDHGMYDAAQRFEQDNDRLALRSPLKGALEVWAHVQSRPEPGLAFLTLGKRDISHDAGLPRPLKWARRGEREVHDLGEGFSITAMNDQHAYLRLPEAHPLTVGDRVGVGCSHPCTTFDKWRTLLVVDPAYNVLDVFTTLF